MEIRLGAAFAITTACIVSVAVGLGLMQLRAPHANDTGAWRDKVQSIWDPRIREMRRVLIKVWDPYPEMDREFSWEPDPTHLDFSPGPINGTGVLTWRTAGAPHYDAGSVVTQYQGQLLNGRPHGMGRVRLDDGSYYEGAWKGGMRDGAGFQQLSSGDQYAGEFRADQPHGEGRLSSVSGNVFVGSFVRGARHGRGVLTLLDGTIIWSEWHQDVEVREPSLWQAQMTKSEARKLEIGVSVSYSKPLDEYYGKAIYAHYLGAGIVDIKPRKNELLPDGNKAVPLDLEQEGPVPLLLKAANLSNAPVIISDVSLIVLNSKKAAHPLIQVNSGMFGEGCKSKEQGRRIEPVLAISNVGLGPANDVVIDFNFLAVKDKNPWEVPPNQTDYQYTHRVPSINDCSRILLSEFLQKTGMDIDSIRKFNFRCATDDAQACNDKIKLDLGPSLGTLMDLISPLYSDCCYGFQLAGRIRYSFIDHEGQTKKGEQTFFAPVVVIAKQEPVECGSMRADDPTAPSGTVSLGTQILSTDRKNYRVALPLKEGVRVDRARNLTLTLKARDASFHSFKVLAKLSSGEIVETPVVNLYYHKLRKVVNFAAAEQRPSKCG